MSLLCWFRLLLTGPGARDGAASRGQAPPPSAEPLLSPQTSATAPYPPALHWYQSKASGLGLREPHLSDIRH